MKGIQKEMRRKGRVKKALSLMLVLAMVLSMNMTAFATETPVENTDPQVEQKPEEDQTGDESQAVGTGDTDDESNTSETQGAPGTGDIGTNSTGGGTDADVNNGIVPANVDENGDGAVDENGKVASVGDTTYGTLAEAIKQANGQTVKLLSDVTEDISISETQNVTLDLAGYILTGTGSAGAAVVSNEGTMTLIDSVGGGKVLGASTSSYYVIRNHGNMTLGIQGGQNSFSVKDLNDNNSLSLIENGWNQSGTDSKPSNKEKASMTIWGGEYTGSTKNSQVIKNDQYSELTINGGTFTATNTGTGCYAIYSYGLLTVNDGVFEKKAIKWTHYCIMAEKPIVADWDSKAEIKGGTFTAPATGNSRTVNARSDGASLLVYGGTHNRDILSSCLPEGYMTSGSSSTGYTVSGPYVAKMKMNVSGKSTTDGYASITEAIEQAQEQSGTNITITLLQDHAEDVVIPEGMTVNLNINNYTLTNVNSHTITNNGTLTVTGGGVVDNVTNARAAVCNEVGATATLEECVFTRSQETGTQGGNSYYTLLNHGTMTLQEDVSVNQGADRANCFSSMIENGWYDGGENTTGEVSKMIIEDGTFTGGLNTIKNDDYGVLEINGGTFDNSAQATVLNWNEATITGGTFTSQNVVIFNGYLNDTMDQGKLTITNGTFTAGEDCPVISENYPDPIGEVTISGGTFNAGEGATEVISQTVAGKSEVAVSSGTFNMAIPAEQCANGFTPKDNGDGTYGVKEKTMAASVTTAAGETSNYETVAEAYEAAADGDTITILQAQTEWEEKYYAEGSTTTTSDVAKNGFKIAKSITLDLNGNTLNLKYSDKEDKGFYLALDNANSTLTIKDSGENGKLTTQSTDALIRSKGGHLILKNGILETVQATRTVYLYTKSSTFKMEGGTIIHSAGNISDNYNAIQISSGTATIDSGLIQTTGAASPATAIRVYNTGSNLIINGGTLETGATRSIYCDGGNVTITRVGFTGSGTSVYASSGKVTIGEENNSETVHIPTLLLSKTGIVDIKDNVVVETLEPLHYDATPIYTFKADNQFGGMYGNDFTDYISGNALVCQKIESAEYYEVVPMGSTDERIVAEITHSDGTTSWFGEAGAAFAALANGDTLKLKKDVVNTGTSSYQVNASNVTIDLGGHSITANNSGNAVYLNVKETGIQAGSRIEFKNGTIQGNKYAILAGSTSSSGAPYTLVVDEDVTLNNATDEKEKIDLSGTLARLSLQGAATDPTICTGKFKTTVGNEAYVYASLLAAVNNTVDNKVELTGNASIGAVKLTNENIVEIDLGTHTLTTTAQSGIVSNGAGLSIKNGTISHSYTSSSKFAYPLSVGSSGEGKDGSSLTLEGVTLTVANPMATAVNVSGSLKDVSVTLKNSTIICATEGTNNTVGVYFPVEGGTLNIENTQITAANAVQVKGGTVNVTGNNTTITATGEKAEPSASSSGCTNTGDAIYVEDTYGYNPIVNISGGIVTSTNANALNYFDNSQENATGKILVSGGEFSQVVQDQYCAEGYQPVETANDNGRYTVETLAEGYDLVGNYKGDRAEADWLVPESKDSGKVFAGWYVDENCTEPYTKTSGAAYAKFVDKTSVMKYLGGSLRMDYYIDGVQDFSRTSLRFGYHINVPEGITLTSWKWNWGLDENLGYSKDGVYYVDEEAGRKTNLVVTNIPSSNFETPIYEQLSIVYKTADGTQVDVTEDEIQSYSVSGLANKIVTDPKASETDKQYAKGLLDCMNGSTGKEE